MNFARLFTHPKLHKLLLYLKDSQLSHPDEHLMRAVRYAQKTGLDQLENAVVIDAGAAHGQVAAFFARNFPNAIIHAFEPNPASIERAQTNTARFPKVKLHTLALSDKAGEATLHITQNQVSSSLHSIQQQKAGKSGLADQVKIVSTITAPVVRLDDHPLEGPVLLLKLDLQGHETQMLRGALETLKTTRLVLTEMAVNTFYTGGNTYHETDALLRDAGFLPVDFIIPARRNGIQLVEFDALYVNMAFAPELK